MARLNQVALTAAAVAQLNATTDPSGEGDLICERGVVIIAAEQADLKRAFKRAKEVKAGYRWVVINREDLFGANPLSLGSKAGIFDADGNMLKNADIPRTKV
jgi:hypothetical protein